MNLFIFSRIETNKKYTNIFFLIFLISVGLSLRLVYFPYELPVTVDAFSSFRYAADIIALGHLPDSWLDPINNGWAIFLSSWFSIIRLDEPLQYMQIQRFLSIIISISMVLTMIIAGLFGILVPVTLKKMNIDPAIASSVFVTTITDVIGFVSFLGVGAYFL